MTCYLREHLRKMRLIWPHVSLYFSLRLAGSIALMPMVKQKHYSRRALEKTDAPIVASRSQGDKKEEED